MEHLTSDQTLAKIISASCALDRPQPQSLPDAELSELTLLIVQMSEAYPGHDQSDSLDGLIADYERLSLRYSLAAVYDALAEWRITPGAKYFPQPHEIADQIERKREVSRAERQSRESAARNAQWEREFWEWVDQRLHDPDTQGMTEQQFLDTINRPGYTGRKARYGSRSAA
jgi:hypothetical protein